MDEILDEKTYETRNVVYASFLLRTSALLFDLFIFVSITFGFYYMFGAQSSYLLFMKLIWWRLAIVISLYSIYFDGSEYNATLGKQIMNIRMLNENKNEINFSDSLKHFCFSIILFFGYFLMLSNESRQTIADKICKVIVVKV